MVINSIPFCSPPIKSKTENMGGVIICMLRMEIISKHLYNTFHCNRKHGLLAIKIVTFQT